MRSLNKEPPLLANGCRERICFDPKYDFVADNAFDIPLFPQFVSLVIDKCLNL